MNIPEWGDITGYIEAWRCWNVVEDAMILPETPSIDDVDPTKPVHINRAPLLRSVTAKTVWQPGEALRACCMDGSCPIHQTSFMESHGIWAKKARAHDGEIMGRVALWGKVIEHEKGYRAEFAYPLSLLNWPGVEAKVGALAGVYGIPVELPSYEDLWKAIDKQQTRAPQNSGFGIPSLGMGLPNNINLNDLARQQQRDLQRLQSFANSVGPNWFRPRGA